MKWFRQAREINRLRAEAAEVDRAALALHDSYKREHERAQKRIDALTHERDTIRHLYGEAERKIAALVKTRQELDTELDAKAAFIRSLNQALDRALAEVKLVRQVRT